MSLPMAFAIIGGMPERFVPFFDLYRKSSLEFGFDPTQIPLSVNSHGFIADASQSAVDEYYPHATAMMNRIGRERGWSPMTREQFDWMRSLDGSLVLGAPETVATKILRWKEVLGVERFMLHTSGSVPHEKALWSIEQLGTTVSRIVRGTSG